jgi:hypothetical protein
MLVGQCGLILLLIFVADAALAVWRRGDRQHAVGVADGIAFCVLMGGGQSSLVFWGVIHASIIASLFYVPVVGAMSIELSRELLRAGQLMRDLRESEERNILATEVAKLGIWIRVVGELVQAGDGVAEVAPDDLDLGDGCLEGGLLFVAFAPGLAESASRVKFEDEPEFC